MDETQPTQNGGNKNIILIGIVAVIIIAAVAASGFVLTKNKDQAQLEAPQNNTTGSGGQTNSEKVSSAYQDGTYEAEGTYSYHSGTESIKVTVTLANGVISDSEVVAEAKSPISKEKQADFIANYKELVVGKNIDDVKLGKVSGSSLTPIGFNAALDSIKEQAQAGS